MDENQTLDQLQEDPVLAMYRRLKQMNSSESSESTKPVTQTIKTDPKTGEETMTISGSPRDLSAANPLTPTVSQPAVPSDYNRFIAQGESGSNPNIGYHNPKLGTAYGSYGITAPAYQDIQRANPAFANRPITSLTPAEQTEAMNTYTAQNAQYLTNLGVEPTPGNLAGAHFLGAQGLSNYLKTGAVSPEAAAANGGEARVRQILAQRMSGAPGAQAQMQPVAGPARPGQPLTNDQGQVVGYETNQQIANAVKPQTTTPTAEQPQGPGTELMSQEGWADRFASAQQNPRMVAEMAFDENAPKWVRGVAEQHLSNYVDQKRAEKAAQELFVRAQQTGDFKPVIREAQQSTSDGSWVKYLLFQGMHLTAAADLEANKLGLNNKVAAAIGPDGERGLITYDGTGRPVSGVRADGTAISGTDLLNWASGQGNKTAAAQGPNGEHGVLTYNAQGAPISGFREDGTPITGKELYAWAAQGPYNASHQFTFTGEQGVVTGPDGKPAEVRQRQNLKNGVVDYVYATGPEKDKIYRGNEIPTAKRVTTHQLVSDINYINSLKTQYGKDALSALAQLKKDRGSITPDEEAAFLRNYGFVQGGVPGGTVPNAVAPIAPVAPGASVPTPAAGAPSANVPTPAAGAPAAGAPATTGSLTPGIPGTKPPPVRGMNEPEAVFKAREDVWKKENERIATEVADLKTNFPDYKATVDTTLNTIHDVISHPGFENSVGLQGWQTLFGLKNEAFPNTNVRDWRNKYKQLTGETFLTAFKNLKGGGAISDSEGRAATEAQAALKDPGISEAEFKRNALILEDTLKRGVNRARVKIGEPVDPAYFDSQETEAYKWAQAHPRDSRTPAIMKKLGLQ